MKVNCRGNGTPQIFILIALLLMAVAVPLATKLVQQNTENRSKASGNDPIHYLSPTKMPTNAPVVTFTPPGGCNHDNECGTYTNCCYCMKTSASDAGRCVCGCNPQPTRVPPTTVPPTSGPVEPTRVPPTRVPPTTVPPTAVPPTTRCETLWWFDNDHLTCSQKQFCGNYMYQGLRTFQTEAECKTALSQLGNAPVLNAIVAYSGVQNGAKCAKDWPVSVTVRAADGTNKTYTGVVPALQSNTTGLQKYKISLSLTDFNFLENVAAFIKGAKHLQVKYGEDNQTAVYNKAGGTLVLTKDTSTSKVYDFSGYPLLAGDVNQDGVVNGQDFSAVKTASMTRKQVADGGYMVEDLNGNCLMESQDVTLLMLALNEKQGQLY